MSNALPLLLLIVIGLGLLYFEVWMFVHAFRNHSLTDNERILWCIGMLLIHPFVAVAYYILVYSKGSNS